MMAPQEMWQRSPLMVTIGVGFAFLLAVSFAMFPDPFIRHDDFAALLADPEGYYIKTLDEGRWLSYLWHLRGFVMPSWLAFALYQLLWAVFAATAALNACGPKTRAFYPISIALFILMAPPAAMISLWFNTLVPGLALVALYGVLVLRFGAQRMRPWLLVFVPVTLMCYTSYPFLLLALCLSAHDTRWSFRDLAGLMILFVVSFALGLLAIYSLNYAFHGVFGIPMAEWRQPNPPTDWAAFMENLDKLGNFMLRTLDAFSHEFAPVAFALVGTLFFGLVFVGRHEGWPAAYVLAGIAAGLGLVALQILKSGILLSPRVLIFVWVLFACLIARMALLAETRSPLGARVLRNAVLIVVGSYALNTGKLYMSFTPWQNETRAMAQALSEGEGPIWITGDYETIPHADTAQIQNPRGLSMRLEYLTGRPVHDCSVGADSDPACDQLADAPRWEDDVHLAHILPWDQGTMLQLPDAQTELASN
ncbi:MAG: hypothetical protein AB3N23_11605 [Paracoccaceae bacterium]